MFQMKSILLLIVKFLAPWLIAEGEEIARKKLTKKDPNG